MFAVRLLLSLAGPEGIRPAPKEWLEEFFMRDFTGASAFDETLARGDGVLEAGFGVSADTVREHFERWLRGRRLINAETAVVVSAASPRGRGSAPVVG